MSIKPSLYQQEIYDEIEYGKQNIVVNAVAGSGKTTTAVNSLQIIPDKDKAIFAAFNGDIVKELAGRIPKSDYRTTSTIHSIGWQSMLRYYRGAKLSTAKVKDLAFKIIGKNISFQYIFTIEKIVDLMRLNLVFDDIGMLELMDKHNIPLPLNVKRNFIEDSLKILYACIDERKNFDFTDMVFIPALNDNLHIPKYKWVFIDECQDFNKAQQEVFKKMLHNNSRFIAVGDRNQAIYGFAGSDSQSFDNFAKMSNTKELPLSICYRCARTIVEKAKLIVPQIEASPSAIDGVVRQGSWEDVSDGDWVLCRNVRPLVIMCIKLIMQGKKAWVRGNDIGKSIIKILKSTKQHNKKMCYYVLETFIEKQIELLTDYGVLEPEKHSTVIEMQEILALTIFIGQDCYDVDEIIAKLEGIFTDTDKVGIQMMTMHKSKGLETKRVSIICPELIPSRFAVKEWQKGQERNLQYVADTRAKAELILVDDFNITNLFKK